MSFKNYYENQVSELNEKYDDLFEPLFEAAETYYNLTTNGIMEIYEKSLSESPKVTKGTNFVVLNPKNEEDKSRISGYKKSKGMLRLVGYTLSKSRITKPNTDSQFFELSKEFITFKTLVANTPEEKALLKKIKEREDERKKSENKTSKDVSFKLTDEEILIFLDILRNTDPTKFARGVYYFLDKDNDLFVEFIYNKKDPKFAFENLFTESVPYSGEEDGKGFKVSGRSQEYEDLQVLGLYFDADAMSQQIEEFAAKNQDLKIPYENKDFKNIVRPFEVALESSDEFRPFSGIIKRDFKKFSYNDWLGACQLANGMTQFRKDVVKVTKPYIIFSSIDTFKKLETELMGYRSEDEYGKPSTADVIVSTISTKDLLKGMEQKNVKLVGNDDHVEVQRDGKIIGKYWQVSLKRSKEDSQLGRTQRHFSKLYKMNVDAKNVFDSYISYENLLTESVFEKLSSTAKKGAKFLKEIGKKFFDKIKYLILALKEWSTDFRNKIIKQMANTIVEDARHLYGLSMNESVKEDINGIISTLLRSPDKNWLFAKEKTDIIGTDLYRMKNDLIKVFYESVEKPAKVIDTVFKKQIFVYSFMLAFKEVISRSKMPLENYIDELLGLYIEAVYGATKLPMYKVYSTFNQHVPYEFIGTRETEKELRKGNILKNLAKEGYPLISLTIEPKKGSHSIGLMLLTNILGEDGKFNPLYTKFNIDYDKNTLAPVFIAESEDVIPTN